MRQAVYLGSVTFQQQFSPLNNLIKLSTWWKQAFIFRFLRSLWHLKYFPLLCNLPQTNCSCVMTKWRFWLRCLDICVCSHERVLVTVWTGGLVKQYLGLDTVEASEPEDLSAAQLSFGAVNFLLILCQLLAFLLPRLQAQPCLLQAWQPLCWYRGDHLKATLFVKNTELVGASPAIIHIL